MTVTEKQALMAYSIIEGLINQVFQEGERYTATQINIHPSIVKDMYHLVKEVKESQ